MKVKEIIKKIKDPKIYIEIKEKNSGASFGFYTKNNLCYNDKYNNETINSINFQYIQNKRIIILEIK